MPETVCAPRLEELAERRQELLDHRDELAGRISNSTVSVPERHELEAVGDLLRETIKDGDPAAIKETLASRPWTSDQATRPTRSSSSRKPTHPQHPRQRRRRHWGRRFAWTHIKWTQLHRIRTSLTCGNASADSVDPDSRGPVPIWYWFPQRRR